MISPNGVFVVTCFIGVGLLVALTLFYYRSPRNKKLPQEIKKDELDCNSIISFLKMSGSSKDDLYFLVVFLKDYSQLNPTSQQVKDFLKAVCLHRHTNAQIILRTQETLSGLNPALKSQLNKIVEIRAGII